MVLQVRYIILFVCILSVKIAACQQTSMLYQYSNGCPESLMLSDSSLTEEAFFDTLFQMGYPFSSIDTIRPTGSQPVAFNVECGPKINYATIIWRDSQHFFTNQSKVKTILWNEVVLQREIMLTHMANIGYPYSRLYTQANGINGDTLILDYNIDTLRRLYIRDIEIEGNFAINETLFSAMTGVREGKLFSPDRLERSNQIIRFWDYAKLQKLAYDFNPYSVDLIYHIEAEQPSRFDLLIGLVPSNRPNINYEITGNAYLDIRNQLKMAERIYLKFDKYANSSQSFDLRFDFPYLPLIRSGLVAEGLIDRRDSSVLDVHGRIGVQYQWKPGLKYAFFLQRDQSRLITINARRLMNTGQLPDELDYNYSAAGLNVTYHTLDNTINPRKGRIVRGTLTGGLRKLVRNGQIVAMNLPSDRLSFQAQYDKLSPTTMKSEFDISWDEYLSIGDYSTLRFRAMSGGTWSSGALYENEQCRLGGFQDFRGFPEKSFHADIYGVMTGEYRFLFGAESNTFVFTDFGFIHQPVNGIEWNFPYSVGIGLNLGTKAGIFGISYSVGGQRGQRLSLDQSRVNFGLMVNY